MKYEMNYDSRMYCLLKLPPQKGTPETVKKTEYKIDLDFDVIYTKHMLIYLKIIYLIFFYKTSFLYMIHWRLNSAEVSDLKIWTTSKNQLFLVLGKNVFGLFTIYKQTKIHSVCIWYS